MMSVENIGLVIDKLVKAVIEEHVAGCVEIEPDRMEIRVEPWEPMKMMCPYGRRDNG